jgi:hypothetical protein
MGIQRKGYDIVTASGIHERNEKCIQNCSWETGGDFLRDMGVDLKIILKWTLKKQEVVQCLNQLRHRGPNN